MTTLTDAAPIYRPATARGTRRFGVVAMWLALSALALPARGQTPPPAPALLQPAAGASLLQPITLAWGTVVDPDGPIGSYTWQVSSTSTFNVVIASGFTN